jgi:xanthosine utilization system XapX-like protein
MKPWLILLGVGILVFFAYSSLKGSGTLPADPITASATLDLQVKAQARITIAITSLTNRIKQAQAMSGNTSNDSSVANASLRDEVSQLHNDVTAARAQLITLGDSPAAVEQWLQRIHWPEFIALESDFFKPVVGK